MIKGMDEGFVRCEDVFGDELTIVNAARVSFGKKKKVFDTSDERLIAYLIRHKHFSPFRHVFFRFHIRAPECVMRQWYKHVVGCEWSYQLHGWNEISGRYVEFSEQDIFRPTTWRRQSPHLKQGSEGPVDDQQSCEETYRRGVECILKTYNELIEKGVAREQARMILPLSLYTETIWTTSLQAVLHFILLRRDTHAQHEIQEYAREIEAIVRHHFPITWKYWTQSHDETHDEDKGVDGKEWGITKQPPARENHILRV